LGPIGSANDLDFSAGRWMSASGALASFRRLERMAASHPIRPFARVVVNGRFGSTPVIENFEPNFREGSGSGNSNRHHLALTSHDRRRPSLQRQDDPLPL